MPTSVFHDVTPLQLSVNHVLDKGEAALKLVGRDDLCDLVKSLHVVSLKSVGQFVVFDLFICES